MKAKKHNENKCVGKIMMEAPGKAEGWHARRYKMGVLCTHLGGNDGQSHAVVGLVQLNHMDLRLTARNGHGPVTHHTGAARLSGANTDISAV